MSPRTFGKYPATIYIRPDGRKQGITISNIYSDDAEWFEKYDVLISMEEVGINQAIVYADIGDRDEDGEPDEIIVFSEGRSCEETLEELRQLCEKTLNERS